MMRDFSYKNEKDIWKTASLRQTSKSIADSFSVSLMPHQENSIQRKASCACGGGCPTCQTKHSNLPVSHPNDASEIEADAMAERVMRMEPSSPINFSSIGNSVPKNENRDNSTFVTPSIVHDVISSSGKSLDKATRQFMESRMGREFGDVKVHTDSKAAESAASINAFAYTLGNHIVFNSGQYAPDTVSGKRLLAHELAHVGQQGAGKTIRRTPLYDFEKARKTGKSSHKELERILKMKEGLVSPSRIASNFLMNLDFASRVVTLDNLDFALLEKLFNEVTFYPLNSIYYERLEKNISSGLADKDKQSINAKNKPKNGIGGQKVSEKLAIWMNAFIPNNIPGTKKVNGDYVGTVFEGPPLTKCFGTDNRSFSSDKSAPNRMRLFMLIDLDTFDIQHVGYSDPTYQVDCDDGTIYCKETAAGRYNLTKTREYGGVVEFIFQGEASDPCFPSPDLDMGGLIRINRDLRRITWSLLTDPFPAFEMYANTTFEQSIKTLFQVPPRGNAYSLIGPPIAPITSSAEY